MFFLVGTNLCVDLVPEFVGLFLENAIDAGAEFLWENPEDQARLAAWLGRGGNGSGKIEAKLKG